MTDNDKTRLDEILQEANRQYGPCVCGHSLLLHGEDSIPEGECHGDDCQCPAYREDK